jgi:hypothetical protein
MTKAADKAPEEETPEVAQEATPEPEAYESEGARYLRIRQEAKEQAAIQMEADAKAALKAKQKRLGSAPVIEGQADFYKRAAEIEKSINTPEKKEA